MELSQKQIKQIEELTGLKLLKENSPYKVFKWGYEFQYDHSRKAMKKEKRVFGWNDYGLIIGNRLFEKNVFTLFQAPYPQFKDTSALKQAQKCSGYAIPIPMEWLKPLAEIFGYD